MFRFNKYYPLGLFSSHIIDYPTPINLNYMWSFGSLAGLSLVVQIVSGLLLAMHYSPDTSLAFDSVEHIMRDVNFGWQIRYTHSNGASMFFIVTYLHISRGLYYGSYMYPRDLLWISGVIIFIIMMATAFLGYVLPWGQMSYWGATVITNLFSAIPVIGKYIVEWLWSGFSVGNPTLHKFYALHFFLPFNLVGLVLIHLALLHEVGSNNPSGINTNVEYQKFYPYFYVKDLFAFFLYLIVFSGLVFFAPNALGDPDNYIPANPLVTPAHIVPEWYFLPFYAILRSIPDKLGGVIAMFSAILIFVILPYIEISASRSIKFRDNIVEFFFWCFIISFLLLGWIGQKPVEHPYVEVGQFLTEFYFFYFLVIMPACSIYEKIIIDLYDYYNPQGL